MNLLALVIADLSSRDIPHALVGGMALAAHGFARATLDADVLILTDETLDSSLLRCVADAGAAVDVRKGDIDDPFLAVIRVSHGGASPVDVLVGRSAWQRDVLVRARPILLEGVSVPVVDAADLVLLKLFAGGPQDLVDAERLLRAAGGERLALEVEARISALPAAVRHDWEGVKAGLGV